MNFMDQTAAAAWLAAQTAPPNYSVFEVPPFGQGPKPHCIYFYYLSDIHEDGQGAVRNRLRVYYHDNGTKKLNRRKVKKVVKKLVLNARRDDLWDPTIGLPAPKGFCPPACGESFDAVKWRRRGYIVIVVDDPHWTLPENIDPIVVTQHKTCNHTFFQAFRWKVKMPRRTPTAAFDKYQTSAIGFRNHMARSEAGDMLGEDEEQAFNFILLLEQGGRFMPVPVDPDGNNLGPPLPPP
ncbi:MAG TPA: hypothetical protein VLK25_00415 [Allosphingosinicella sp.]|nr:hypothetical protein [Allosphingosinicella sp.]